MDSKLTLKLNQNIIEKAKNYAAERNLSLSRLIENYLDSITQNKSDEFEISPFVKSISTGKAIEKSNWKEQKEEYYKHLEEKYK